MVFFLTRLRQMIDSKYLSVFEPLLEEELTDIPVLPKSFARLKTLGDRIDNLNDRELFYTEYLTRYKQAKSAGRGDRWYDATGWCAYTTRGDTRADALATCLYDAARFHLHGQRLRTDYTDGDPDLEADFYILRRTIPPAVLVENFFMDSDTRLSLPSQS